MSEPISLAEMLFWVFVVVPTLVLAICVEIMLIVTAIYRFMQWVEKRWWL